MSGVAGFLPVYPSLFFVLPLRLPRPLLAVFLAAALGEQHEGETIGWGVRVGDVT